MKLYGSDTSPFVRKVRACAEALDLTDRIVFEPVVAWDSPAALLDVTPLSKVPVLVTEDGTAFSDSPLICEFLDSLIPSHLLLPAEGAARWRVLRLQVLADGMMDAAVARMTARRFFGDAAKDSAFDRRQADLVARALDALERDVPARHVDLGTIATVCALDYLDLRFGADDWRARHPMLSRWHEGMAAAPCLMPNRPTA